MAAGQLGLTGGAQPIFFPKSTKNKLTTTFGSPTAQEISSNYSIRQWNFLFIIFFFHFIQIKKEPTKIKKNNKNHLKPLINAVFLLSVFVYYLTENGVDSVD
jgi:hypothetical protein